MSAPDFNHDEHQHHQHEEERTPQRTGGTPLYAWAVVALAVSGIIIYLLVDHWPHVLAALPYLGIIAMMLMHLFMHKGHGGHGGKAGPKDKGSSHSGQH
ncbi:DUF2933 domain-containing protein [Nesterenkonia salmonea]|uniref:DUF2933 domain-containing protein n=1 Tax=Nesterenkonia salmonea TaxID=1804987 RepID=UPI001AA0310D|nr:DUF2933 domain-containing protein [Nesterenkonia salmonea]